MSNNISWKFSSNNNGELKGIADAGIETFKNQPLVSLAREICQNSLDAIKDENKPVLVDFDLFNCPHSDIPDIKTLQKSFKQASEFETVTSKTREFKFYNYAKKILSKQNAKILRISDHNTTGLNGSHTNKYDTAWSNLVKGSGFSNKPGTSGGSFGIGKNATFACSALYTVFYSTLDSENQEASQGVVKISSFRDDKDNVTSGVGFWGDSDNKPVFKQLELETSYKRTESGTDIYIIDFNIDTNEDWQKDIIVSVLDSFLYAVYQNKLIVNVGNIVIKSDTLESIITKYCNSKESASIKNYYRILTDTDKDVRTFTEPDYQGKGQITLKLLLASGMHRKVAMIRSTGMKILDRSGINSLVEFAGLLLIEGKDLNDYLRSLENPQHNEWSKERAEEGHKTEAGKIISGLTKFIMEKLNEIKPKDADKTVDPGIGDFLPDLSEEESETKNKQDIVSNDPEEIKMKEKTPSQSVNLNPNIKDNYDSTDEGPNGDGHGDKGSHTSGGGGDGDHSNKPDGTHGSATNSPTKKMINIVNKRIVCLNKKEGSYKLIFIPLEDIEKSTIKLFQSGETDSYPADIVKASVIGQNIESNNFTMENVKLIKNSKIEIEFKINSADYSSFEVGCYAD